MWKYRGQERPPFAIAPEPGQESVWDYPRPPKLVPDSRLVIVGEPSDPLARTERAQRVLETASPPTYYLPAEDVDRERLRSVEGASHCEWKGVARYWALVDDGAATPIAWSYDVPTQAFRAIAGFYGFFPGRIPCFVDGERVQPQPGGFYGGWITDAIVGPVKGAPGTSAW